MLLKKYNIKNSTLFWNSIPIIIQIIFSAYFIEMFIFIQVALSIMAFFGFLLLGGKIPYFMYFTISVILLWGLYGFLIGSEKFFKWLFDNPVKKFNTWLDTEKVKEEEKKLNFNEFTQEIKNK
jgi:hypothetical protein